jgi:hypothetical protein
MDCIPLDLEADKCAQPGVSVLPKSKNASRDAGATEMMNGITYDGAMGRELGLFAGGG